MKQLRCVVALLTATLNFGITLAGEPDATAPTELVFDAQCETMPPETQEPGHVVTGPRFTPKNPPLEPPYPAKSRKRGERGTVQMRVLVNEQGRVARVKLVESTGYPALDKVGLESTRDWKLAPGTVDGNPKCMWGCSH
jgi:TonB family protein